MCTSYKQESKNWKKGIIETKAMKSVTKDVLRVMILDKVNPVIKERWLATIKRKDPIVIQKDNAKLHCTVDGPKLIQAMMDYE